MGLFVDVFLGRMVDTCLVSFANQKGFPPLEPPNSSLGRSFPSGIAQVAVCTCEDVPKVHPEDARKVACSKCGGGGGLFSGLEPGGNLCFQATLALTAIVQSQRVRLPGSWTPPTAPPNHWGGNTGRARGVGYLTRGAMDVQPT